MIGGLPNGSKVTSCAEAPCIGSVFRRWKWAYNDFQCDFRNMKWSIWYIRLSNNCSFSIFVLGVAKKGHLRRNLGHLRLGHFWIVWIFMNKNELNKYQSQWLDHAIGLVGFWKNSLYDWPTKFYGKSESAMILVVYVCDKFRRAVKVNKVTIITMSQTLSSTSLLPKSETSIGKKKTDLYFWTHCWKLDFR